MAVVESPLVGLTIHQSANCLDILRYTLTYNSIGKDIDVAGETVMQLERNVTYPGENTMTSNA